jgi:hypothetical protein
MRTALPLLLLLAGCASQPDFIDETVALCEPGQPIDFRVGLDRPEIDVSMSDRHANVVVEVANNSDAEVTVRSIRVEQTALENSRGYRIDPVFREFDQTIEEGKDHLFRLPVVGRLGSDDLSRMQRSAGTLSAWVTVSLSNGEAYRCQFALASLR